VSLDEVNRFAVEIVHVTQSTIKAVSYTQLDVYKRQVLLGSNDNYANQVFRVGSAAWGFQFHFEVSDIAVKAFVATFAGEIARAGLDAKDVVDAMPMALNQLAPLQSAITTRFAQLVHDRDLANWRH